MATPIGERVRIFRNSKNFHPRVSINVEFKVDLVGKLLRLSTYSITPEKLKIISPMDEAGSQVQDDCLVTERRKAFSHDSTQLASDQRDNVLDPMKSKLRPVSVKTTVACSRNLVLFLISRFRAKIYLQSQIYLSTFLRFKIHMTLYLPFQKNKSFFILFLPLYYCLFHV